jgi:hypothetical protein
VKNVVKLLLESAVAESKPGKDKDRTPLLEACKLGNGKASGGIIGTLCAKGASLDCYSERGANRPWSLSAAKIPRRLVRSLPILAPIPQGRCLPR